MRSYVRNFRAGFTIVELLIVVIVIAILATIVLIAYNGIIQKANNATVQSDLQSARSVLESDKTTAGNYPTALAAVNGGKGFVPSGKNQANYIKMDADFCLAVANPATSLVQNISSKTNGALGDGMCDTAVSSVWSTWVGMRTVAADTASNVYVNGSDQSVTKITPAGVRTTLAGVSGQAGYIDGPVATARFTTVFSLTADSTGNVYVGERFGCLRKIAPDGTVSLVAGLCGTTGNVDNTGAAARLGEMRSLVSDAADNIYALDSNGIRKITPSGVVTTIATGFTNPTDFSIDANGWFYVSDNSAIYKVSPTGVKTLFAGAPGQSGFVDNVPALQARFGGGSGVGGTAVDASGNVYVADRWNHRIRIITPDGGWVSTLAGTGVSSYVNGPGKTATFSQPLQLRIDPVTGALYEVEWSSGGVRKITL